MNNNKINTNKINIAIIGCGNCASSLAQGLSFYDNLDIKGNIYGLMHEKVGDYRPSDIEVVCAFDVDERKVGFNLNRAIFSEPNCTKIFNLCGGTKPNPVVLKAPVLDGVAEHMKEYFQVDDEQKELSKDEITKVLKESKTDVIVSYLPVGSYIATRFWAQLSIDAGCAFVNCIPEFVASDEAWRLKFEHAKLPVIGDDIKSEIGATIIHRVLTQLFKDRGVKLDRTYQLNTAGNMDFLNMLDRNRLVSKKISKTEAIQSVLSERLEDENIHIGPSDYVPWLKDNKIAFIRMEGRIFGNVPINLEMRLSVEDSPNSAGCVIDCIRLAKLALDRGIGGSLVGPSAYYMKHPLVQYSDETAKQMVEDFINEETIWRNK